RARPSAAQRAVMEAGEASSLLGERSSVPFRTYRRRWFLLAVVCLLNCSNAMLWLTFAPVADRTASYFHISLETVNWLSLVYLLISIPFGLVATWVLDSVGLRWSLGVYAIPAVTACVLATVGIHSNAPPTPPSASATNSTSQPFLTGLKMLLKNKSYLILAVCFGGGIGVFTCFSALLEQILCEKGYSNVFAGLNGALFTMCGLLGAFLLGLYVDRTRRFIESTKICFCLSALASIVFAVASRFRHQAITLAVASSLFGFFGFAIYPIAMELAVECSYPVGEGTSTGLIFVVSQVQGVILMILLQALTMRVSEDSSSACDLSHDGALDWTSKYLPDKPQETLSCSPCALPPNSPSMASYVSLRVREPAGAGSGGTLSFSHLIPAVHLFPNPIVHFQLLLVKTRLIRKTPRCHEW
uniref:Solute carrier family 49 member 3 n=1 Tax=Nothoprocta perdicaria TaxID=30464 RepID=A0A8C6Z6K4_NOTPE